MTSTTPTTSTVLPTRPRSTSRTRIPSRPTTPLRPSSRTSLRNSLLQANSSGGGGGGGTGTGSGIIGGSVGSGVAGIGGVGDLEGLTTGSNPLDALEGQFAELSDGMADLEANFMHLQLMHESLARFSESFAAFLYGLNMNAFCVDFPEAPIPESFKRIMSYHPLSLGGSQSGTDVDATFLTTDTSFVENPPASSKASSKFSTPAPASRMAAGRGAPARGGRGIPRGTGIARAVSRGRAGRARGSTT